MSDDPVTGNLAPKRNTAARWAIIVAILALVAAGTWVYLARYATYHLIVVDEGRLYRDGNRGLREFRNALRIAQAKTVISIVDDDEVKAQEFRDEEAYLRERGIAYVRIPIVKGDFPTTEQVRQFLAIAADPSRQPVLFHDNEGIRRAGMMMAAYQKSILGYDTERAKSTVRRFGHSDRSIGDVMKFIECYDGATRTLTLPRPTTQASAAG